MSENRLKGKILTSERLRLRPLREEDVEALAPLFADVDTMQYYLPGLWRIFSGEQTAELLKDWHDDAKYFVFAMEDTEGELLGLVNLDGVDWVQRNTEVGLALLSGARGRGYAGEAMRLLLDYLFRQLNLHRVFARIMEPNKPSRRLFERLGFVHEGSMREQVYRDGAYVDMCFYGLLQQEYLAAQKEGN